MKQVGTKLYIEKYNQINLDIGNAKVGQPMVRVD